VDDVQLKDQILYFDDIQMNDNKIKGLAEPSKDSHATNKKYVDDQIAKLPHSDNGTLKLDGSRAMTSNLKMGDHTITGIRSSSADNAALTVGASKSLYLPISGIRGVQGDLNMGKFTIINIKPFVENESAKSAQDNEVINFGYFSNETALLKTSITDVGKAPLNRKNPDPMLSPINMGKNFITNVKDPLASNSNYAATVNFVNKTVSDNNTTIDELIDKKIKESEDLDIQGNNEENVFSFVMKNDMFKEDDSDISKVGRVDKDFYKINKETYQFNIDYDSQRGYYSTRLGIDLKAIDLGEYALVFEMYFNETKIDKNQVVVDAVSTPLNISRKNTNKFSNRSRTVINFHKYGNIGIIDLDFDITLKKKWGLL